MIKYITLFLLAATILSCNKKNNNNEQDFVAGDVLVGFNNGVTIEEAFELFNKYNLKVHTIRNFVYEVTYPEDKHDSIIAILGSKPYIDTINWKPKFEYNYKWETTIFSINFFGMTQTNQDDWIKTKSDLMLPYLHNEYSSAYLKVPEGTEKHWVSELQKSNIINWAELNHIIELEQ